MTGGGWAECPVCGAVIANVGLHQRNHQVLVELLAALAGVPVPAPVPDAGEDAAWPSGRPVTPLPALADDPTAALPPAADMPENEEMRP